jgi:hypothetical protein
MFYNNNSKNSLMKSVTHFLRWQLIEYYILSKISNLILKLLNYFLFSTVSGSFQFVHGALREESTGFVWIETQGVSSIRRRHVRYLATWERRTAGFFPSPELHPPKNQIHYGNRK